jgi:pyruvate dehydrogenase E1 component
VSYDPAYAYELAVIIQDGIRRMYTQQEHIFYYITVMNEQYEMPPMPEGSREGILKGMYRLRAAEPAQHQPRAHLLGGGAILNEALKAQQILAGYNVAADVWSVTSYQELYRDGHAVERWNRLHPGEKPRVPYVAQCLGDATGAIVAASDYVKVLFDGIDQWLPRRLVALGTDGFGRSDSRAALRDFFEVDARFITVAALSELASDGSVPANLVQKAIKDLGINPDKPNPATS